MAWNNTRWLPSMLGIAFSGLFVAGCGKTPDPASGDRPKAAQTSGDNGQGQTGAPVQTAQPGATSLKDACVGEAPEDQFLPDRTAAGKSVGKLYLEVAGRDGKGGLWDQIAFTSPSGKSLQYYATIRTNQGNVKIQLRHDLAPNHVRNFIALARAGYYDGLFFDRTMREEVQGQKGTYFEYLEAGCPLGNGDPGYNSIGYWLLPEIQKDATHEEGTVGAWHAEDVETAGCKFYITLSKAPLMDGEWTVFGKVVQGLDVLRVILSRPVNQDEVIRDRPREPVAMQAVVIESVEVDAPRK